MARRCLWATSTSYSLIPQPRAHRAADPDDPLSLPPHGTEVFVGGVPRTATEAQLTALAAEMGAVHSVALLKDPQNAAQNRGRAAPLFPILFPVGAELGLKRVSQGAQMQLDHRSNGSSTPNMRARHSHGR